MPDDITIAPIGSPYPVVTDELAGGRHVQVMKTGFGGDGILTPVDSVNPLPVASTFALPGVLTRAWVNANVVGSNLMLAGTPGTIIRVYRMWFVAFNDVQFQIMSAANAFHPPIPLLANGSFVLDLDGEPWFVAGVGEDLNMVLSVGVQVSGQFYFTKS